MSELSARNRVFLALFTLGAFSQIAQALLIRETLVVFYGNEVSLGAFFASWLFWIACGSLIVVYSWRRGWAQRPRPLVSGLMLLLPLLLTSQIVLTRAARLFLNVSATEFMPLSELFLAILVITLPTGLCIGLTFPLASKALEARSANANGGALQRTVANVSWLYVFAAVGALAGGVAFTFALVEGLGVWRSLGLTTLLLAIISAWLGGSRWWSRGLQIMVALIGLGTAMTPVGGWLQERMEGYRFQVMQPGLELLDSVETRYGHVAVARRGEQTSIVSDGRIAESYPATHAVQQEAAYLYAQASGARNLLLFGGLSGGLAEEFLHYPVAEITVVEQDQAAFEMLLPHLMESTRQALADPRLKLHFMDGRRFTNRLQPGSDYDLVLVLAADPSSADSNRYFTLEFYQRLSAAMAADGVLCTAVSSASNYLGREVKSYSGSVLRTLSEVFPQVAIMPGDEHLYCASRAEGRVTEDPAVLEARYLGTRLDEDHAASQAFYTLLPADRIAFVREQLDAQAGTLNTDVQPITYYYNMVLWGKFSASAIVVWLDALSGMGYWPYLIPLGVFVLLLLLRTSMEGFARARRKRHAATFTLALLGMIAMAIQLAILFAYQAHVGFMFSRVALLNGLFMTGIALGAGLLGQRLARRRHPDLALAVLMALVAAGIACLPAFVSALSGIDTLWQEAAYLALSAGAGLLTGTGFPLGVHQAHVDTGEVLRSSGIAEAADDMGGAFGGLLTGALLVPILGVTGTSYLLAGFAVIAVVPLLHAHFSPAVLPGLTERGYRSFPWALLSWGLVFLVLTAAALSVLARGAAPAPTLEFSETVLGQVSGSQQFVLREKPIPHYLGDSTPGAAGELVPETVSMASMAVAADVRGYAGPINLLVSVAGDGMLRGVRYVASDETPTYIAGIDAWLTGLAGRDVSHTPLALENYDALSGATLSSRAALDSINRALQAGGQAAFAKSFAGGVETSQAAPWLDTGFVLTLALLLAFFPVYLSGYDRLRTAYQLAVLSVLGFYLNTLFTEIDLLNLSQGHVTLWAINPQRWLILGFVLLVSILFGQAWCGYVCPFGALQELLSRIGRFFYLRNYVEQELERRVRYLKYLLLTGMLIALWITGDAYWGSFDPMQYFFGGHFTGWIGAIVLLALIGSVVYVRFWCRYFCPVGAFLALFNKFALLDRHTPKRRFDHCDLGVRHQFDVDCIRCHRCVSGRDYGIRHKASARAPNSTR